MAALAEGPRVLSKKYFELLQMGTNCASFCDDLSFDVVKEVLKERIIIVSLITASFVSNVSGSK